ncbi:MAG: aspartate aminotransferase family protein [Gammaproteobacteria bacterium]|nr:aspartate aminotransferase family protein [Gammaproteobacteria bacterium]
MKSSLMSNYGSPDLEFDHGKGCYLFTADGDQYLDFAMGIAVNCLGHCHPALVDALTRQAGKLWHTSNLYRISQAERLARRLTDLTFADRVFFSNSGTEAVECGFKMIRRYQHNKGRHKRKRIIALSESFHGRTLAPIAASANPLHMEGFLVGDAGFDQVSFGDGAAMAAAITEDTAGIVIEPIQGEGGIRIASKEYLQQLRDICNSHDLLLMFDEVQCGLARAGSLFAYQQSGITPDILASAKGLGGGFPIGACLSSNKAAAAMVAGTHGSTFGGNPLASAVANAVLDEITAPGFMDEINSRANYLHQRLQELVERFPDLLQDITGAGLMIGINCKVNNSELMAALTTQRLLSVKAGNNSIRFLPPLNVSQNEIDEALTIFESVLKNWQP